MIYLMFIYVCIIQTKLPTHFSVSTCLTVCIRESRYGNGNVTIYKEICVELGAIELSSSRYLDERFHCHRVNGLWKRWFFVSLQVLCNVVHVVSVYFDIRTA